MNRKPVGIKSLLTDNLRSVFVILCIIVFILINIFSQKAVERYGLKLDLTENSLYEFSDITESAVEALNTPVKITVFNRKEDYVVMLREVLLRYSSLSSQISLEFVDPYENPVLIDSYAAKGIQIHENDILMEGIVREKIFTIQDMYTLNAGRTDITGLNAEQQLTSALYFINDGSVPVAAFSDGHNERPGNALTALFSSNNYDVIRGNLNSILRSHPELLVIAAPSRDFQTEDILLLNSYMEQGGNALVFLEPSSVIFPNLEGFLENWGIIAGKELVFEEQAYTAGNPVNIVPMYAPHEINRYFMETRIFLTMPSSRSLYESKRSGSAYNVNVVLGSTPGSYGKTGYQFSNLYREAEDADGPFNLLMSSERTLDDDSVSRLIVAGSMKIYGDDLMGFSSYGNSEFLVQTINWLSDEMSSIHIPAKKIKADPLNLQSGQILILALFICGLIPIAFFAAGFVMFIKRKRL